MDIHDLIDRLGYAGDPGLLDPLAADSPPGLAHHFRRAHDDCGVKAIYCLRAPHGGTAIPLVYLAEADTEDQAPLIHRKVWNQNLVPFLVVSTPGRYVLYPGFRYSPDAQNPEIDSVIKSARLSLERFQGLDAKSIVDGRIWNRWGGHIELERRVDWTLLSELEKLGRHVRTTCKLSVHQAHALIGKYVFLRYLRDRRILSDERLTEWGIASERVFGRNATLDDFVAVNEKLDAWLNGSVFPVDTSPGGVSEAAIRQTAAVFAGDRIDGQMSLFDAYDFAFIPIETLSVIYQQFLHAEDQGRAKGAYYTPVNLVDLILDEMENRRPLLAGTTVLDPACGSGAFLVQAYRRLIERQLQTKTKLRPIELRTLLIRHIHGVDQDEDACRVASLSLVLTLLDYVNPPDLLRHPEFKLPTLYGSNIVLKDFFDADFPWGGKRFDWIVGNPPWREVKPKTPEPGHTKALGWMRDHRDEHPIGGWQLAEAFAWKVGEHVSPQGAVGLLMPAMSLFKVQSTAFRARFFAHFHVWCVANFANLAYRLFAGRSEVPAAALFYTPAQEDDDRPQDILTYTPFLANQPAMHRGKGPGFKESWILTVNGGELRQVDRTEATRGEGLTWKLAMWGSHRDRRLLARVDKKFPAFREFRKAHRLRAHQGLELRYGDSDETIKHLPELVNKRRILPNRLARKGRFYCFPDDALEAIGPNQAYARVRGGVEAPLSVCSPPHLVLGRSREWAIFSDEFLVIPPRQLGIAGGPEQRIRLKALTLYLSSDFVRYHQLFHAAEMGVQASVADMANIEELPIPLDNLSEKDLQRWANLYDRLADVCRQSRSDILTNHKMKLETLEDEANEATYVALGLSETERWLVSDLVHGRMALIKGQVNDDAIRCPKPDEIHRYGEALRHALNGFLDGEGSQHHDIDIYHGDGTGIVAVSLTTECSARNSVQVHPGNSRLSAELDDLRQRLVREHTHWLYFERGLTLFDGKRAYLIKPLQRLHWLRSQALLDADNLIADMLSGGVTAR